MAKAPKQTQTHVFTDDDGEVIKDMGDVVSYYREKVEQDTNVAGELTASDEKVGETLLTVPGNEETANDADTAKIKKDRYDAVLTLVEVVQYTTPSAIDSPLGRLAISLAEKMDTAADDMIDRAVDNKEAYEGAPLEIAEIMVPLFGGKLDDDGTVLECDTIRDQFPWPGSKQSEAPAGSAGLEQDKPKFDRYEFSIAGQNEPGKGYFLGDFQKSTPHGKEIEQRLDAIKILRADATSNKIGFDYRTKFLVNGHVDPIKVAAEEQYWRNRRTARINRLARTIKYIKNAIGLSTLKDVSYTFVQDDKERRFRANKPIKLMQGTGKKTVPYDKPLSLSQFCNFRIDEALKLGGTMNNLIATLKREPATPVPGAAATQQGGGTDRLEGQKGVPSPEQVEAFTSMLVLGLVPGSDPADKVKVSLYESKLMSYFNQEGPEGDERVETLRDAADALQQLVAHYAPRLAKIAERKAKAA
jgi:hypothetical protein